MCTKSIWRVCTKSINWKWKWYRGNDYSWKLNFYWVITWKLLVGKFHNEPYVHELTRKNINFPMQNYLKCITLVFNVTLHSCIHTSHIIFWFTLDCGQFFFQMLIILRFIVLYFNALWITIFAEIQTWNVPWEFLTNINSSPFDLQLCKSRMKERKYWNIFK